MSGTTGWQEMNDPPPYAQRVLVEHGHWDTICVGVRYRRPDDDDTWEVEDLSRPTHKAAQPIRPKRWAPLPGQTVESLRASCGVIELSAAARERAMVKLFSILGAGPGSPDRAKLVDTVIEALRPMNE